MKRAMAILACLTSLSAACQAMPLAGPAQAPAGALAAADSRLYRGDYDGAEAAYRKLIDSGGAGAKAHYALLLDYENRFAEAVTMARSAADGPADSRSLAGLTRALDWSEDVAGAIDSGGRAIKASPVDPVAHAFYAEALADGAHFREARAQLLVAEKTAHDAYTASEVERDWANYYRGQGDTLEELNHLQLSLRAQPDFPERVLEMARYQYGDQQPDAARKLLAGLRKKHGSDYGVSVAAADTAFLHGDIATAEAFYQAALKVRPSGTSASLGEAELLVSSKRDFTAAHDLLLTSLKANTGSADVYYYLRHLDLLVLKTDPDQELSSIVPQAPTAQADAGKAALSRVNAFRTTLGIAELAGSVPMAEAAVAHAYFYLFNFGQPGVQDLKIHDEDPTLPGAFGASSLARAKHFGYGGDRSAEVISHVYLPAAAVDHWVDAVFHRYPLADPETVSAGYGQAEVGALSIQVLDLGLDPASTHGPIVYPVPNQPSVPFAFTGAELPDPAPAARYPTGYPITLQVGAASALKVTSAVLTGPGGNLAGFVVDPSNAALQPNEWAVLPRDPLLLGATYTVKIAGTIDDQAFEKTWSFSVAPSP